MIFLKYQFIIAGFRVFLHINADTGQFCDYQFAGGVDDAPGTEMTANGREVFSGQGNVQMAPGFADSAVQTDNFAVVRDFPDGNTAGIPDPAF